MSSVMNHNSVNSKQPGPNGLELTSNEGSFGEEVTNKVGEVTHKVEDVGSRLKDAVQEHVPDSLKQAASGNLRHVSHVSVEGLPTGHGPFPIDNSTLPVDPAGHNNTASGSATSLPQPLIGSVGPCFLPGLQIAAGAALMAGCAYKAYQEVMKFFPQSKGLCETLSRKKDQLQDALEDRKNQFQNTLEDRKNQVKHTVEDRKNQVKHTLEDGRTHLKHALEDGKTQLKHTLFDPSRLYSSEKEPSVLRAVGYGCLAALGVAVMIKA